MTDAQTSLLIEMVQEIRDGIRVIVTGSKTNSISSGYYPSGQGMAGVQNIEYAIRDIQAALKTLSDKPVIFVGEDR